MGISGKAGIYQLVRTFLYYYCSKYYHTTLSSCRIRFTGEAPAEDEWDEALAKVNAAPDAAEAEGRLRTFRMRVPEAGFLEKAGEKNLCSYAAQLFEKAAEKTGAEVQKVCFMGMAEYDDAEQFVTEYHINSQEIDPGEPVRTALEFTDMNGYIYFDIEQRSNDPGLAEAFAAEIRNEEISCEMLGSQEVKTAQLSEDLLCIIV